MKSISFPDVSIFTVGNAIGDQPENIEEQVRSMCFDFISNPNAIILAVTAANQDLVNSDGLKMARR